MKDLQKSEVLFDVAGLEQQLKELEDQTTNPEFWNDSANSGKILKQAMKKYGRNNFITTIVEWCETPEKLKEREIYWIDKCDASNFCLLSSTCLVSCGVF